ncbi:MAG: LysR family transcriptional regulator substrate-binding protein, partial [Actinomycetota bacterium]|nr:LysR family transcriptional regulator substrate-binding protein [Actinomycetota bacterium]
AEAVLAAVEAAAAAVGDVRDLRGGLAAFGTWGTARTYLGTDLVEDFRRQHPDVRVRLVGQNSSETAEAIRAGELEAGMIALPIDDRGLAVRPAMRDEILYASADPARLRGAMTIERLADAPLILPDASWGSADPTRRQLSELAQRRGVRIEPQIDVEDVEVALELAARGLGDTIVARGMLRRDAPPELGWTPFAEPIYDTFAFIWRRGAQLSPATREFMTFAERRLAALGRELRSDPPRRRRPDR